SVAFCAASLPISISNWPRSAALATNCASGAGSGVALALIVPLVPAALLLSTDGLTPAVVLLGDWLPGTVPVAESLVPAGGLVCAVVAPSSRFLHADKASAAASAVKLRTKREGVLDMLTPPGDEPPNA